LREGKQHSQCDFIPTLDRTFDSVHQVLEQHALESHRAKNSCYIPKRYLSIAFK